MPRGYPNKPKVKAPAAIATRARIVPLDDVSGAPQLERDYKNVCEQLAQMTKNWDEAQNKIVDLTVENARLKQSLKTVRSVVDLTQADAE